MNELYRGTISYDDDEPEGDEDEQRRVEDINAYHRQWRQKNAAHHREYMAAYMRQYYKDKPWKRSGKTDRMEYKREYMRLYWQRKRAKN